MDDRQLPKQMQNNISLWSPEEENQILEMAVAQMNVHVFVYDIPLQKLYFFRNRALPFGVLENTEYRVGDIINHQIIDEDYTAALKAMFDEMECGGESAESLVKLRGGPPDIWKHILLTNCFDSGKKSIRAIGTIQDVSKRVETELRYTKEKQYRLAMMADSRRVYEINVTKDRFTKLESIQDSTDYGTWSPYSKTMAALCEKNVFSEDWGAFLQVAKRENLIEGFRQGVTEFYCEYRFVDENGDTSWTSSATHLLKDPLSDDVKGFIYVKDIDKQKRLELELYRQAEHDPLTGIYNRRTAERSIDQILAASDENQLHGFLTIDVDDFKLVNDHFGHMKGDGLLKQMAQVVGELAGSEGVFARMGGDEFVVFLKNAGSLEKLRELANRIRECVQEIRIENCGDFRPTVSIGIAVYPSHGTTFAELYRNSDAALYEVKAAGKNHVSVFHG